MLRVKTSKLLPFSWRKESGNPLDTNFELIVKNGACFDKRSLFRLLETSCENYKSLPNDFDPKEYLVLGQNNKAIAAVKYVIESDQLIIKDTIVNPMYPENSVTAALYWILKGCGGRLPLE